MAILIFLYGMQEFVLWKFMHPNVLTDFVTEILNQVVNYKHGSI